MNNKYNDDDSKKFSLSNIFSEYVEVFAVPLILVILAASIYTAVRGDEHEELIGQDLNDIIEAIGEADKIKPKNKADNYIWVENGLMNTFVRKVEYCRVTLEVDPDNKIIDAKSRNVFGGCSDYYNDLKKNGLMP
jgi:hypothetical protein